MHKQKGFLAWLCYKPMYINLALFFIIASGLYSILTIKKESLPKVTINEIEIYAFYKNAGSKYIDSNIISKIEQAIKNLEGIKNIRSVAKNNYGMINVELKQNYDAEKCLNEVEKKIDQINDFPSGLDKPTAEIIEMNKQAMIINIESNMDYRKHQNLATEIKKEIETTENIGEVSMRTKQYEINILITPEKAKEHDLSLSQIAEKVEKYSKNISGGTIKTKNQTISIESNIEKKYVNDYKKIKIKSMKNGELLLLSDIAEIKEIISEDEESITRVNGKPSMLIFIKESDNGDTVTIANRIKKYIKQKNKQIAGKAKIEILEDTSEDIKTRIETMISSLAYGSIFVFLTLAIFLETKLAFWVAVGIPVCFLAALACMPLSFFNVTLNLASMFGFIMVLGILVDDAIVIGESAYSSMKKNGHSVDSILEGVKKVSVPAIFGVLTTMTICIPMLNNEGYNSENLRNIGTVVLLCLFFSLIESKIFLPCHIANMSQKKIHNETLSKWKLQTNNILDSWVNNQFSRYLQTALTYKYTTISLFISLLVISIGAIITQNIKFNMDPEIEESRVSLVIKTEEDTNIDTAKMYNKMAETALYETMEELEQKYGKNQMKFNYASVYSSKKSILMVKLIDIEDRDTNTKEVESIWKSKMPKLEKALEVNFKKRNNKIKDFDIEIQIQSTNPQQAEQLVRIAKEKLKAETGVTYVVDSMSSSQKSMNIALNSVGNSMNISLYSIMRQINQNINGIEATSFFRSSEEIKVKVTYPKKNRDSINDIYDMEIINQEGKKIPLVSIATITIQDSSKSIRKFNGKQTLTVKAQVEEGKSNPAYIESKILQELHELTTSEYTEATVITSSINVDNKKEIYKTISSFMLALVVVYILLAIPLESYLQPFLVMITIPFGLIGVIAGHLIMGLNLSYMSIIGFITLSGIAVNDSLVMIDFINNNKTESKTIHEQLIYAAQKRFRAVFLTSITTIAGLMPMLVTNSEETQLMIPVATSMVFGVGFTTIVTLILIPAIYTAIIDIKEKNKNAIIKNKQQVFD